MASSFLNDPFGGGDADAALVDAELILWLKGRITLVGFASEMWREEFGVAVSEFLSSKTVNKLVMYLVRSALDSTQYNHRILISDY